MTLLVLRKLLNNKWMFVCLLIGFLIIGTVISSIPIFTDAVLQRVLILDLQEHQARYNEYPGTYRISQAFSTTSYINGYDFGMFDGFVEETADGITVPKIADATRITMTRRALTKAPYKTGSTVQYAAIEALKGLEDKVQAVYGRMFTPGLVDGVYEAVISEYSMKTLQLEIGAEYWITYPYSPAEQYASDASDAYFRVKIVGVVTPTDINDPYWFYDMLTYTNDIFLDYNTVAQDFKSSQHVTEAVWYKAYDYTKIEISDIRDLISTLDEQKALFGDIGGTVRFSMPTLDIMKGYLEREASLQVTLWVLIMPLMVLLCFYIFMVSRLKLQNEADEISVLKSRGAGRMQIFSGYVFEWGIMAAAAMLLGPPLGYLTCYFLGSSNGFLDFVSRTALPINMSWKSYLYTFAALLLFAVAMLIPALKASRLSIVERKQLTGRVEKRPLWQRMFLDVILLGASIYMLIRYNDSLNAATNVGGSVSQMGIDPLMYIITSLFMLGSGLLFLRIYPYIVRFIFFVGKKHWSPPMYSSFVKIGRSGSKEVFVMLFIIYSVAVGIFSANAARTVNSNLEDRYEYVVGTDVVADVSYSKLATAPDFEELAQQQGIGEVAHVLNIKTTGYASTGFTIRTGADTFNNFSIMGIEPYSFGTVAKMRSNLLPTHLNNYLNAINGVSNAVLLSADFEQYVAVGDTITLASAKDTSLTCVVYGFFDYWPGYEPVSYEEGEAITNSLVIMNSSYLLSYYPNSSSGYDQFWFTRTDGSSIQDVTNAMATLKCTDAAYNAYAEEGADTSTGSPAVSKLTYLSQSLVRVKNDPTIQGFNGMLSLVFLITMGITTVGFLIYWVLSLKSRTLQFGVYRAIGMSQRSILGMILIEQVLVSLVAIGFGLILGDVTSYLCVPLFEMVYSAGERVIPFNVVHQANDYLKIYLVIAVMLTIGFFVLRKVISSIKIDQALKLGED